MAKQSMIPGTCDEVPPEVEAAAEKYLKQKRLVAKGREQMNAALEVLIAAMRAAGVHEMLVDDGEKRLILDEKDVVRVVARKKGTDDE
jgi:D-aminopeptidase